MRRRAVIKYVAYIESGVHSGTSTHKTERDDKLLRQIRSCVTYTNGVINMHIDRITGAPPPLEYNSKAIDPVLYEMLSTAFFLATSPEIAKLETIIRQEVGA